LSQSRFEILISQSVTYGNYFILNLLTPIALVPMRWVGHVACMGEGRGVPMGRPRRRWEDNIKVDFQELGGGCGDWIELAQDRERWRALVSTVMNLRVPKMRGIS